MFTDEVVCQVKECELPLHLVVLWLAACLEVLFKSKQENKFLPLGSHITLGKLKQLNSINPFQIMYS